MPVLIFLILQISGSQAISCTAILQSLDCLPAFTHAPASLTKCYCSSLCPSIEDLRQNCQSGQLQTDPCGVCLQCAPGVSHLENHTETKVLCFSSGKDAEVTLTRLASVLVASAV